MSHGLREILSDNEFAYYESEYGIKIVPHNQEWIGYYRLGEKWNAILTSLCYGKAPGELVIPIRSYEDLARAFSVPAPPAEVERDPDYCPLSPTSTHVPAPETAMPSGEFRGDEGVVIDISCQYCGRSGSFHVAADDVNW